MAIETCKVYVLGQLWAEFQSMAILAGVQPSLAPILQRQEHFSTFWD
jgi:hypothetical protein